MRPFIKKDKITFIYFLGTYATIGISRTFIDNSELEFSLIGRMECTEPGNTAEIDADFLVGVENKYGYSRDNCETAKTEMLAREIANCTYAPHTTTQFERCSPTQSVSFYRSFFDSNTTATPSVPTMSMDEDQKKRFLKTCPQECKQDRYSVSASYGEISDSLKTEINDKLNTQAGGPLVNLNVIVMKFYLNSMEYQKIQNFPQHGLQFVAEVGGLMSFFLGISVISIIECMCYALFFVKNCCCGSCFSDDGEDDLRERDLAPEELPPPRWKDGQQQKGDPRERYDDRRY